MYFQGFTTSQQAHINVLLANTCLPLVGDLVWPQVCRVAPSFTGTEPYAFNGATPYMTEFDGQVPVSAVPSFSMNVPNRMFVNAVPVSWLDLIGDQTAGTVAALASQIGLNTVWNPEYLFFYRLLTGRNVGSNLDVSPFDGKTYSVTPDGLPIFSQNHPSYAGGGTQSNIIQGSIGGTPAAINAAGVPATANALWSDLQSAIAAAKKWKNTNGAPLFPSLRAEANLVIVAPPDLDIAMNLAMSYRGLVNATTNILPERHKQVITSGLAAAAPQLIQKGFDPSQQVTPPVITASGQTAPQLEYYVFVTGWTTGASYVQVFNPLAMNQTFPGKYDPVKQIDAIVKETGISQEIATTMAMSLVQTDFDAMGTKSNTQAMLTKQYHIAGTQMANVFFPWPGLIYRGIPSGGIV